MALPTASDNQFPKVILEEVTADGSATVTPAADHRALFLGEDGALHLKDSAGAVTDVGAGAVDAADVTFTPAGTIAATDVQAAIEEVASEAGGGSGATAAMNQLASDVTMASGNTWYDGPSLSLADGTYVLMATVTVRNTTGGGAQFSGRITDGTTHLASVEIIVSSNNVQGALPMVGYVVVSGGPTTWKAQAAPGTSASGLIKAANVTNATGNVASTLVALKIA